MVTTIKTVTAVLTGNDPLLAKNITQKGKRFMTQPKHIIF